MHKEEKAKSEPKVLTEDREDKIRDCIEALKKEGVVNAIPSEEAESIKKRKRAWRKARLRKLEKKRKLAKAASKQRRNSRR